MFVLSINTKNEIRKIEYDPPHYDVLRDAVGGWYEHVRPVLLCKPYCMMVNEEGLLLELPKNQIGSWLYGIDVHGQPILGDIVLAKEGYYNGEPDVIGMEEDEAQRMGDDFVKKTYGVVHWVNSEQKGENND